MKRQMVLAAIALISASTLQAQRNTEWYIPTGRTCSTVDVEAHGLQRVWKGIGCDECRGTGYRGRTGIYELVVMDHELRLEVQRRRGSEELRAMAIAKGMRTLLDDGIRAAREGVTTIDEVMRVARA